MLATAVGRLRFVGIIEGISYLLLLGIAMPLKYMFDIPQAVSVVGALHGLFFVLFLLAVAHVTFVKKWSFVSAIGAVVASVIPFGTFVLDAKLRDND
ncbi:DUF3817 domain-containing protein [Priestia koreensis]|uniref:DUF3817 domain-containing protein n=1 Tax=Priestia koreensis TaxID=284581 RepID=A0A0M0LI41_9BACI|nr:DUF3817 domain-containing protein [Priestia koreensis]KOO50373.1 hypothetical protein AMD01_01040 [Priestia koreensis]MCM3002940.1 DUF3817 domain-containing protein [Priestia koreensis]UNL85743.1 DUF3817 domain-containing protein [Priestia koreensis]